MTLQDAICVKLRKATEALELSQHALGRLLAAETGEKWPQSRVWKLLHGQLPLTIDILAAVATVLQLSLLDLLAHTAIQPKSSSPTQVRVIQLLQQHGVLDDDHEVTLLVLRKRPAIPKRKPRRPAHPA